MNTFLKNTLRTGIPFGVFMGIFNGMQSVPPSAAAGVLSGVVSGSLFGVTMAAFMRSQQKRAAILREEFGAEGLVLDAAANHGAAGGWLFLTKQRIVFVPHRFNFGKKRIEIALPSIAVLREVTGGMKRGVEVGTTDAVRHTFVVQAREQWLKSLSAAVAEAGGNARTATS